MECSTKSYEETNVHGMSQLDLVIKVYDGAITAYQDAAHSYKKSDSQKGYDFLERAKRFVVHLYTTLDEEKGAEIATGLGKLYSFVIAETDVVSATKDIKKIDDLVAILDNLRQGWLGLKEQEGSSSLATSLATAGEGSTGGFTTSA